MPQPLYAEVPDKAKFEIASRGSKRQQRQIGQDAWVPQLASRYQRVRCVHVIGLAMAVVVGSITPLLYCEVCMLVRDDLP